MSVAKTIRVSVAVVLITSFTAFTPEALGKYSGGAGDPNDPYRIATAEDLNDIGNYEEDWDKHFILVNDVNLAQYTATQFNIIGKYFSWNDPNNKPFTGVFDGNDHKVWNFTWSSTGGGYIGLFSSVGVGGRIKNLGMENVDLDTASDGRWIGPLVGANWGSISDCYARGNVNGYGDIGGLVGWNAAGSLTNCYSAASVTGGWDVGGLVGENYRDGPSACTACYATGDVKGDRGVGGLVGSNWGTLTGCYATSSVSGTYNVGGLVAGPMPGSATACFWDIETSGQSTSGGGIGKTTAEMKTISTFTDVGWDFMEVWGIVENQTYPYLRLAPSGDLNYDRKVDFADLAIMAWHWLRD